jgi:phosphatidylserine/phosphatidylglycerophosphate/cardiolipin synthase-like enzyme
VFIPALSLALGALSFAVPVSSLGTGVAVAVCFSPEEDCTALAVDAIDRAEIQILVSAYGLTTSSKAVEALMQAKRRGVDVRVIADRTTPCERKSGLGPLAEAGVPIWIDNTVRIAHSKSMVIDSQVTLTGSMNWTGGAAQNSENLNLVASKTIAAAYAGIGISALRYRCRIRREKAGAGAPTWPISIRNHQRDENRTARPVRSEREPRKCPLKAYNGDAITRSDCASTSS